MMKSQLDMKQKLRDALDTARAAELALREVTSSLRAAKQQIALDTLPFDFEPLSLDFPALTLQCLEPPPTLFSSTQYPTATSWSISPPGSRQYEALRKWFSTQFRNWKFTCRVATTVVSDDLSYPPPDTIPPDDNRAAIKKAEKAAETLELQVDEHLESMYNVWEGLAPQRRQELWILDQHALKQENANLKLQIENLNRLQQPREFKISGLRATGRRCKTRQAGIKLQHILL
ncbi:hypothetical protein P8C59_008880 [Phyllachora maydis]|uniref:Uncharacterized protein n=1 Tax=Phyllachora maydis TaxID=1825666 RepID=A0AAD9IDB2_9PEZI|nr:hypothetical protein P8C59_008880 [Phyllachora maydis]